MPWEKLMSIFLNMYLKNKNNIMKKLVNDYIRSKSPELKNDKRNFLKIFNEMSPQ
jgi:hypothetical protein